MIAIVGGSFQQLIIIFNVMVMDKQFICGLTDSYIDRQNIPGGLHEQVVRPFMALQASAAQQGFDLAIASAYRDYYRQLKIWNAKAMGQRPVLDNSGQPINIEALTPWQRVQAILRWSALPGASRHHWGTDIDVYDRRAIDEGYSVQLVVDEVTGNGPFVALHEWLDQQIAQGKAEGFFRPYPLDTGGIAPERWHLSYAPVALGFQKALDIDTLRSLVNSQPIALKEVVIDNIDEIYQRYIHVPLEYYPDFKPQAR